MILSLSWDRSVQVYPCSSLANMLPGDCNSLRCSLIIHADTMDNSFHRKVTESWQKYELLWIMNDIKKRVDREWLQFSCAVLGKVYCRYSWFLASFGSGRHFMSVFLFHMNNATMWRNLFFCVRWWWQNWTNVPSEGDIIGCLIPTVAFTDP